MITPTVTGFPHQAHQHDSISRWCPAGDAPARVDDQIRRTQPISPRAVGLQNTTAVMARREGGSRPICRVCEKPIAENEPHYRAGLAWLHTKCYEETRLTTTRKRPR
jgi:hypothetical protein